MNTETKAWVIVSPTGRPLLRTIFGSERECKELCANYIPQDIATWRGARMEGYRCVPCVVKIIEAVKEAGK